MAKIEDEVEKILKEKIESIGYELYDVIYIKEGKNYTLRIVIDKPNGIDLNDCEKVNNEITVILDEKDLIKEQYFLEVSSPGIERQLRKTSQLLKYIDHLIEVKLFKKDKNGNKQYQGKLKQADEKMILIEVEEKEIVIERKEITQIKTIYEEI